MHNAAQRSQRCRNVSLSKKKTLGMRMKRYLQLDQNRLPG
jgi:hypothetical protein